jgi:hypothetical protein
VTLDLDRHPTVTCILVVTLIVYNFLEQSPALSLDNALPHVISTCVWGASSLLNAYSRNPALKPEIEQMAITRAKEKGANARGTEKGIIRCVHEHTRIHS